MLNKYLNKTQADTLFNESLETSFESQSGYSVVDCIETDFGWIYVYDVLNNTDGKHNFEEGTCCFVTFGGTVGGCPDPRKKELFDWSMKGIRERFNDISNDINHPDYWYYYNNKNLIRFDHKPPRADSVE